MTDLRKSMLIRTPPADAVTFGSGHHWPDANWQVIFKTAAGLDYCRETQPGSMTMTEIGDWARRQLANHKEVSSAVVERW